MKVVVEKETIKDMKIVSDEGAVMEKEPRTPVNGRPSGIRTASEEQFQKAHRKTSAQHAGLFRRLAK
jgi:hypothetical protein